MELNRFVPAVIRRAWTSYHTLNNREYMIFWASVGNIVGATYGYMSLKEREANKTSDHMQVMAYAVPKEKIKSFEAAWNEESRSAQQKVGYEWTKMFKAISWEYSPYQYISIRMWGKKDYMEDWLHAWLGKVWQDAEPTRLGRQGTRFVSVVDDSVVRLII